MGRSKAKVRVKVQEGKGKAKGLVSKIRAKIGLDKYVGDESRRLRTELDSIKATIKVEVKK